jgi:hypothetical protein
MQLFFTLLLVLLIAVAYLFYDKFTRKGAVPLGSAWKSFTVWLAAAGTVLGQYLVDLFAWGATQVDFLQDRFGGLLADPSAGQALQLLSWFFLLLRLKGQGLPSIRLPDLPDDTNTAGA